MKIGKQQLTFAPNIHFWMATAFFVYLSIANNSVVPILIWIGILAASIPPSLWLAKKQPIWDAQHKAGMIRDFGNDPEVQMKFGDCKTREEAFQKAARWQPPG